MNKITKEDIKPWIAMLIVCAIAWYAASRVEAYTISHNRIIYAPAGSNVTVSASSVAEKKTLSIETLPDKLIISRSQIEAVFKCHATDGSVGYQGGYDTACDDIRELLGLKASAFKSRPSTYSPSVSYANGISLICLKPDPSGYISLNASEYRLEYMRKGSPAWPKSMNYFDDTRGDVWRVWPDHHTIYRNGSLDFGFTYEDLENISEE